MCTFAVMNPELQDSERLKEFVECKSKHDSNKHWWETK